MKRERVHHIRIERSTARGKSRGGRNLPYDCGPTCRSDISSVSCQVFWTS